MWTESPPQPIISAQRAKFARVCEQERSALMPPPISKKPVASARAAPSSKPVCMESSPEMRESMPEASRAATRAEKSTTKPQTLSMFQTEAVTARASAPGCTSGTAPVAEDVPTVRPRMITPEVRAAST